ncbi:MAG TPA: hypothetical protein VGK67_18625 [Myxococcales bacterium]|jgi:hypothetical protein
MRLNRLPIAAALLLLALAACKEAPRGAAPRAPARKPGNVSGVLDQPFVLGAGDAAPISQTPLVVRFIGVANDSRCPSGARCALAGSVQAKVQVDASGQAGPPESLTLSAGSPPPTVAVAGFTVTLTAIDPGLALAKPVRPDDYRATLVVSRSQAAPAPAQAGDGTLTGHLAAGKPAVVILDGVQPDADESRGPLGTLKGGERYTVAFNPQEGTWAATGYNKGTHAAGTWTYPGGRPEKGEFNLWGHPFRFDEQGVVTDAALGKVGRIERAPAQ